MSTYQGSRDIGPIPPRMIKSVSSSGGRHRSNKYANLKPLEQKNTSGQRRAARKNALVESYNMESYT